MACVVSRDQQKLSKQRAAKGVRFHPSLSAVSEISLESDQSEQADSTTLWSPFQTYADRTSSGQAAQVVRSRKATLTRLANADCCSPDLL